MSKSENTGLWQNDPFIPGHTYFLNTKLMRIILWESTYQQNVWRCKLIVREHVDCAYEFFDIVDIDAKDPEEAKGKAILSAFDLVIAHAFAGRDEVA